MSKIKETITALAAGNESGAVHINRKENAPMSDKRFEMILKCVVTIALIAAVTVLVLKAGIVKLVALLIFGIYFSIVYFASKD